MVPLPHLIGVDGRVHHEQERCHYCHSIHHHRSKSQNVNGKETDYPIRRRLNCLRYHNGGRYLRRIPRIVQVRTSRNLMTAPRMTLLAVLIGVESPLSVG